MLYGGCTGVFAAVRAARLGAKVALIEASNAFGGAATNGFVCVWHTLHDTAFKNVELFHFLIWFLLYAKC